ncbi:hypothetical protein OIDMADRAFT_143290 [Oidiodendron maius Zn]|uniref:Uncharacterized protein n=1 Tax=Oidiodendron maius (strain Zn) TaxID=913774 RepID=A0A0C3HN97_OIDMZ|nr:hypothetical protein OIDMADRAFT_143290 [Oidiodendron maius Zn]
MVLDKLQRKVFSPPFADMRPSKAHPEHRARRKQLERDSPAFDMKDFGIKTAMIGLLALVACFPWEKELEKHERRREEEGERERTGRRKGDDDDGESRGRSEGGRERRRIDGEERRERREQRHAGGRERTKDRGVKVYRHGKSYAW